MKTRETTTMAWNPDLAINDNMLGFIPTDSDDLRFYLHSVKAVHLSGENHASVMMEFFCCNRANGEPQYPQSFWRVGAGDVRFAPYLQPFVCDFHKHAGTKELVTGNSDEYCFQVPLIKPFTETILDVMYKLFKAHKHWYWLDSLEIMSTTEVSYEGKWIPFARFALLDFFARK